MIYLTDYSNVPEILRASHIITDKSLVCHVNNIDINNEINSFSQELSQKIFLAASSDQVFLFLPQESKKLLFTNTSDTFHAATAPRFII